MPNELIRPGSVTLKVNLTYLASLGPTVAFTASLDSSCCATVCHWGLLAGSFALEAAMVSSPFAP